MAFYDPYFDPDFDVGFGRDRDRDQRGRYDWDFGTYTAPERRTRRRRRASTRPDEMESWESAPEPGAAWSPSWEVKEKGDDLVILCEIPGFKKEDINIHYEDGKLTIRGNRPVGELQTNEKWVFRERLLGPFNRSLKLPHKVKEDQIQAFFEHGNLKIVLPQEKAAPPQRKSIDIQ